MAVSVIRSVIIMLFCSLLLLPQLSANNHLIMGNAHNSILDIPEAQRHQQLTMQHSADTADSSHGHSHDDGHYHPDGTAQEQQNNHQHSHNAGDHLHEMPHPQWPLIIIFRAVNNGVFRYSDRSYSLSLTPPLPPPEYIAYS